jgi:hypothetical protein
MEEEFGIQPSLQIEENTNVDEREKKWSFWKIYVFKGKSGGWKHIIMVRNCCHKYYFLKLHVFELLPS